MANRQIETTVANIVAELRSLRSEKNLLGMKRFAIDTEKAFGIKLPLLRAMAKPYRHNHDLALALWQTGYHECRLMAIFIDDPRQVTEQQMESWIKDFRSWDLCDQACALFAKTPFAVNKVEEWSTRVHEFEKRAAFALIAWMAVHLKKEPDDFFIRFMPIIERECCDERNFVKKAVNWALRQIGKRNQILNNVALNSARKIKNMECKSARWIANNAIKELEEKYLL